MQYVEKEPRYLNLSKKHEISHLNPYQVYIVIYFD